MNTFMYRALLGLGCISLGGAVWAEPPSLRTFPNFSLPMDRVGEQSSKYPLKFEPSKLTWTVKLEGYGQSSPAVYQDRVVVSSVTGPNKEVCKLVCLKVDTGEKLWGAEVNSSYPEESTPMISRAAPTPVCDDKGFYVFYESGDLCAFSHSGTKLWHRSLQSDFAKFENKFGLSSTPVHHGNRLYVLLDHSGESSLVCISKESGATVWSKPRGKRAHSWSSPAIIQVEKEPIIVCSSVGSIDAYSMRDGELLSSYSKVGGNSVATPYDLGSGRFLVSSLIRPADGPSENATVSNLLARILKNQDRYEIQVEWIAEDARGSFCSPIEHLGFCYWINPQGVLFCLDARTGKQFYAKRTSCGACWATPFAVGDRIYLFGKEGDVSVIRVGAEYEELSSGNRAWEKASASSDTSPRGRMASPTLYAGVPVEGGFLLRRGDAIYRVDQ